MTEEVIKTEEDTVNVLRRTPFDEMRKLLQTWHNANTMRLQDRAAYGIELAMFMDSHYWNADTYTAKMEEWGKGGYTPTEYNNLFG